MHFFHRMSQVPGHPERQCRKCCEIRIPADRIFCPQALLGGARAGHREFFEFLVAPASRVWNFEALQGFADRQIFPFCPQAEAHHTFIGQHQQRAHIRRHRVILLRTAHPVDHDPEGKDRKEKFSRIRSRTKLLLRYQQVYPACGIAQQEQLDGDPRRIAPEQPAVAGITRFLSCHGRHFLLPVEELCHPLSRRRQEHIVALYDHVGGENLQHYKRDLFCNPQDQIRQSPVLIFLHIGRYGCYDRPGYRAYQAALHIPDDGQRTKKISDDLLRNGDPFLPHETAIQQQHKGPQHTQGEGLQIQLVDDKAV